MLTEVKTNKIKAEIKQVALDHLHAKDAKDALSYFSEDIIAVSNEKLFVSFKALADDVNEYYTILKEVHVASWDDINIQIINRNTATFIAKFRYSYSNINDEKIDLRGIWTALYVCEKSDWKIRLRHESFTQI